MATPEAPVPGVTAPTEASLVVREDRFPRVGAQAIDWETRYVVSGIFTGETGIAFVGRFCNRAVVNVSQGGGLIGVLQAEPRA